MIEITKCWQNKFFWEPTLSPAPIVVLPALPSLLAVWSTQGAMPGPEDSQSMSHVMCHKSQVTIHNSKVTSQMSYVGCHKSLITSHNAPQVQCQMRQITGQKSKSHLRFYRPHMLRVTSHKMKVTSQKSAVPCYKSNVTSE